MKYLIVIFSIFVSQTLANVICDCYNEGRYIRDPTNSNRYYLCQNGIASPRNCPLPSQFFNENLQECDCDLNRICDGVPNGRYVFDPMSVHHYFHCIDCIAVRRECAPNSQFNEAEQTCVPQNVIEHPLCNGRDGIFVNDVTNCHGWYYCHHGQPLPGNCSSDFYFDYGRQMCYWRHLVPCNITNPTEDALCANRNGQFIKDPQNCYGYFYCNNGRANWGKCTDTFYFNEQHQMCDYQANVQCVGNGGGGGGGNDGNTGGIGNGDLPDDELGDGTGGGGGGVIDNEIIKLCPTTGVIQVIHPSSCSKYVLCSHGVTTVHTCAPGTLFDASKQLCNLAEFVECSISGAYCPTNNIGVLSIENPIDCGKYIVCYDHRETHFTCATGLYFNPIIGECDFPENVHCKSTQLTSTVAPTVRPILTPPPVISPVVHCPSHGNMEIPHPTNCKRFVVCMDGVSLEYTCIENLVYDTVSRKCDLPEKSVCFGR